MALDELSALPRGEKVFIDSNILTLKDYALLTNDAFHVATMKRYGIVNIATNAPDFERVEWIKVWKT